MPVAVAPHIDCEAASAPPGNTVPTAPLRVLTILYGFAPGGVERVAARLHAAWCAQQVASVIMIADHTAAPPFPLAHVEQAGGQSRRRGVRSFVMLVLAVRRAVRDDPPDILFCAGNTYSVLLVAARLVIGRRCPPIVCKVSNCLMRRDMSPSLRWLYHRWLRLQGRWIDHFVGLAPATRDEIARFTHAAPNRISVIEDPLVDQADLTRLAAARDMVTKARQSRAGRQYLAVGRLVSQKNFALLLNAFAQIAGPGDRLTVLGEGCERRALERLAATLGIAATVCLPGHVASLDPWLADADALVLSSDYEGVPAVLVEGLAAGLPIVATRCCVSIDDLLGHGAFGMVVPVRDPAALGAALSAVVRREPDSIVEARRAAAAAYSVDRASLSYLVLMRDLAQRHALATLSDRSRFWRASLAVGGPIVPPRRPSSL